MSAFDTCRTICRAVVYSFWTIFIISASFMYYYIELQYCLIIMIISIKSELSSPAQIYIIIIIIIVFFFKYLN